MLKCEKSEFCISILRRCDGVIDCPHSSTDDNCPEIINQFQCENGRKISVNYVCNHADDCQDNSDEKYCGIAV